MYEEHIGDLGLTSEAIPFSYGQYGIIYLSKGVFEGKE
jgi:hypothetical protein